MKKRFLMLFISFLIFVCTGNALWGSEKPPVKFDPKGKVSTFDFFEKEYRSLWNSLSEEEQFAIACSSNVFERNKQFHLDFTNNTVFDRKTRKGINVLNENWKIFNYEQLMENFNELTEGEQAQKYRDLLSLLEQYPDLTPLEIGIKEDLTVTAVSRMYMIQDKKEVLGIHGIEAWIDARRISIIRWGISAGYIEEAEARNLIYPIVKKIKDDYINFEDFISHWMAGYCFNAVFDSECPECSLDLIDAYNSCRAYIPYEELKFTGINADKNHAMKIEDSIYTPSETASKMIPAQKAYKRYVNEDPDISIYDAFLQAEKDYPEISNLLVLCRFILMVEYADYDQRIEYAESKMDYLNSISPESETYYYVIHIYMSDLVKIHKAEKALNVYKNLPLQLQTDETVYYIYGYANYLMSFTCSSILERDIYVSRAKTVFKYLSDRNYNLGDFIKSWLQTQQQY